MDVSVRPGEVVALFGKLGSGAAEVGEIGLRDPAPRPGHPRGRGQRGRPSIKPSGAIAAGIGFLPADRKAGGAFAVRPVAENVAVASWSNLSRFGVIRDSAEAECLPALARPSVDPLAQRSEAGDGHALGRQPAEGPAGALAGARLAGAGAHRTDARRRRRRSGGYLSLASRARRAGCARAGRDIGLRGGGAGRRSRVRHEQGTRGRRAGRSPRSPRVGCWPPPEGRRG